MHEGEVGQRSIWCLRARWVRGRSGVCWQSGSEVDLVSDGKVGQRSIWCMGAKWVRGQSGIRGQGGSEVDLVYEG